MEPNTTATQPEFQAGQRPVWQRLLIWAGIALVVVNVLAILFLSAGEGFSPLTPTFSRSGRGSKTARSRVGYSYFGAAPKCRLKKPIICSYASRASGMSGICV